MCTFSVWCVRVCVCVCGLIKLCKVCSQNFDTHRLLTVCIKNINAQINIMLTFCHAAALEQPSMQREDGFKPAASQGGRKTHFFCRVFVSVCVCVVF